MCSPALYSALCHSGLSNSALFHCFILHCVILHCVILHCVILNCVIQLWIILNYVILYCDILHCVILHYAIVHHFILHWIIRNFVILLSAFNIILPRVAMPFTLVSLNDVLLSVIPPNVVAPKEQGSMLFSKTPFECGKTTHQQVSHLKWNEIFETFRQSCKTFFAVIYATIGANLVEKRGLWVRKLHRKKFCSIDTCRSLLTKRCFDDTKRPCYANAFKWRLFLIKKWIKFK
jgi:hypothetical protein